MSALTPEPAVGAPVAPTGEQWTIGHGPFEATVVEVGGGLRTLTHDGRDLVAGFEAGDLCGSARGQQLMPWPNRIRDGVYSWAGVEHQLPLTEVPHGNAIHGLVRWDLWELVEHEPHLVTVGYRLHPQPGWDHHLDLRTTYVLDDSGLVVTTAARNVGTPGTAAAPFGYGAHPYLSIGTDQLDDVRLTIAAETWVEADERRLPIAQHSVEGTNSDFRAGRLVGAERLDTAYTGVVRDADGMWRCSVETESAGIVTIWADASFPWLQVYTGVASDGVGALGIAIEPMTCPAEAFNSGTDLVVLEPGDEWTGTWGITPT